MIIYLHSEITDRLAQLVEQRPFKAWVLGSNPRPVTKKPRNQLIVRLFLCVLFSPSDYTKTRFKKSYSIRYVRPSSPNSTPPHRFLPSVKNTVISLYREL